MLGLGPVFRLILGLTNTSANTASRNLFITFYCDDKLYTLAKPYIQVPNHLISYQHIYVFTCLQVPMLVPGLNYNFETLVECISEMGVADQIRWAARVMCHMSCVTCHL